MPESKSLLETTIKVCFTMSLDTAKDSYTTTMKKFINDNSGYGDCS